MSELNVKSLFRSQILRNSVWGVFSNILQTLFVGAFFIILARKYAPAQFAEFLIGTTVYQLVASFSSLGLGQWFIRRYASETDKPVLIGKFLRTQLILGFLFYVVNIVLAYMIYPGSLIRILCIILGTNIVFDNFINAIRSLNIAESRQKTTALILIADGFMKLLIASVLFITPLSLISIACLTIAARVFTLALFLIRQRSALYTLKFITSSALSMDDFKHMVLKNWQFIVIGSIAVVYWRIGNVIISKMLTLNDVAAYEIAYRFFSVLQIIPVMAAATVYPRFVAYVNASDSTGLKKFYLLVFTGYSVFAVVMYLFFYSFSQQVVPLLFGSNYPAAAACLQQMFLTFLLMPTVLLQANLIVAMGLESRDMWFNIVSLLMYVGTCLLSLHFDRSLAVVNYSIFLSFVVFHLLQDVLLIKRNIIGLKHPLLFYTGVLTVVVAYRYSTGYVNPYLLFGGFTTVLALLFALVIVNYKNGPGVFSSGLVTPLNTEI
jgi:O-antigen/teichoic acid export membrane protein